MQIETSAPARGLSLDAWVFLGTVVFGAGSMFLLKLLGTPQIWTTLAVAGVVIGYSIIVVTLGRLHLRLDQAGDNAYYLGLIFTLLSMATALWQIGLRLTEQGSESISVAETVIGDFGLALGTTLAGIICRIILHQMRLDPADVESESRIRLTQATARMVSQLNDMTTSFGEFQRVLLQKQGDYANEMAALHKTMREEMEAHVRKSASDSVAALTDVSQRVAQSIEVFSGATSETCQAFQDAAERLRAVEPPPARLSKRFDDMATKVEAISTSLCGASEQLSVTIERMHSASEAMVSTADATRDLVPAMKSQMADQQRRHTQSMEILTEAAGGMGAAIKQLQSEASRLSEHAGKSAEAVEAAEKGAVEVLDRLTEVVRNVDKSIAQRERVG